MKLFLILITALFLLPSSISALESEKSVPVKIKADKLEYIEEQNLIIGEGNVDITQGDTRLQADFMEFFTESDNIHARGNVTLWQKENTLKGEELEYNIKNSKGIMEKSKSSVEPWFYRNEELEQVNEDKFYAGKSSSFTTCENEDPHYCFEPKEIIIYPKHRIVCREVFMLVKNVPIIYFPFYTRRLDVKNRLHIKVGYSRRKGIIVRAKYDYSFNSDSYGDYYLDWWQFVGWGTGFNHNYSLFSGRGKGNIYLYYTKFKTENPADDYAYSGPETEDWYCTCRYEQKIYEKTEFETTYDRDTQKELVKEKKLTVEGKLDVNYQSNIINTRELQNPSDATRDINSNINITTTKTPNIVFRVAGFQKNRWDEDFKKFRKTEEKTPDISFSILPTSIMELKTWRGTPEKRDTVPVNYSLNATYAIKFDRGDREEIFEVVQNDLNPDAGIVDTYIVKLSTFPSSGTVYAFVRDNNDVLKNDLEVSFVDFEKKEVTVKNPKGPFRINPRDRITVKYATKFATQMATLSQRLQSGFDIFKGDIVNISLTPSIGSNEDWRDKKTMTDPNERRISSYETQLTLSSRITNYITWQNTHSYRKRWQEIDEDSYKGIEINSLATSLGLDSPFNENTPLFRTSVTASISYDLRSKKKSFYDTTMQKIIVTDEKEKVENKKSNFSDLLINLRARPKDYFELTSDIKYDIYCDSTDIAYPVAVQEIKKGKLKSIDSSIRFTPNIYLDLTYRQSLTYFYPTSSFATMDSMIKIPISRYWEGSYLASFRNDNIYVPRLKDFEVEKHRFILKRDLHCWEAEFSIRKQMAKLGVQEEVEFWFVLNLKAFPERKMGLIGREKYIEIRDQI